MTTQVRYGKTCRVHALGRNRYIQTTGLDILATGAPGELILYPINSRGESSNSCCIPIPMTAAPAVADALIQAATPALHDQLGWSGTNFWLEMLFARRAVADIIAAYENDDAPDYDDAMEAAIAAGRQLLGTLPGDAAAAKVDRMLGRTDKLPGRK